MTCCKWFRISCFENIRDVRFEGLLHRANIHPTNRKVHHILSLYEPSRLLNFFPRTVNDEFDKHPGIGSIPFKSLRVFVDPTSTLVLHC